MQRVTHLLTSQGAPSELWVHVNLRHEPRLSRPFIYPPHQTAPWPRAVHWTRPYRPKDPKIRRQTLIVCEKSQTFQSTVSVRASPPHWQLHHRKYLNVWFWSRVWGESWCAKQLAAQTERWIQVQPGGKKKRMSIRAGRDGARNDKHIILLKSRVPGCRLYRDHGLYTWIGLLYL